MNRIEQYRWFVRDRGRHWSASRHQIATAVFASAGWFSADELAMQLKPQGVTRPSVARTILELNEAKLLMATPGNLVRYRALP